MEHLVSSELHPPISVSSNAELDKNLLKVNEKATQLKVDGMTRADQEILKSRLNFVWTDPNEESSRNEVTPWRHGRARRAYRAIQDADNHLFLAVLLAIPPTECAKTRFDSTADYLTGLGNYGAFHLNLSLAAKRFFDSTAAERGFTSNNRYQSFIQALFPQEERRQIKFAYSLCRPSDISSFIETVVEGIYTSQLWTTERMEDRKASGCVTIFIPTGEEDGSCNLVVDRKVLMEVIHRFRLSDLKLE